MTKTCPDCNATVLSTSQPAGDYVLMPSEATRAMTMAACDSLPACEHVFGHAGEMLRNCYRKMVKVAALAATPARPTCRLCGLEDGACICAHLPSNGIYTDQPIFDAIAAATQIDSEPDGVPRIVMSAAKFIEVFNNHRDRALCTSLAATPTVSMIITETMIEAGARIHNPFAFDIAGTPMPVHRAQSRDEARKEVHAILSAALAAAPAVDHADYKIGGWLSAALEDPNVCAAMKADINAWFEAHQPGLIMSMSSGTQGALALYLNEVQPVDGRVQINVSIDELMVLRHLAAATPAVGGEDDRLPRCEHGNCLRDGSGELLEPPCGCRAAPPASPLRGWQLQEIHAALFEPEESDAYDNLDGALIDIERLSEQDKPTDAVCIRTIRRVLTQLNAVHNVFSASPPEQPQRNLGVASDSDRTTTVPDRTRDATPRNDPQEPTSRDSPERRAPPEQPAAYPSAEADEEHADLLRRLATVPDKEK